MAEATATVAVDTKVKVGFATYLGTAAAFLGALGTVYAAVESQDTATAVSGVGTITALALTLGGRFAQSIVIARAVARAINPYIDALAEEPKPEA